jgi:hypothetical protein
MSRNREAPSSLLFRIGRVAGILILLALCVFAFWRVRLYRDVNSRFASIRAAGFPVSGEELNAWLAPVPEAENGALVLTQAFALFRTFPDRRSNEVAEPTFLDRTNKWSAATRAMIEAYVQTNAAALAKVREAGVLSRFRYPVDFSYGPETPLPHLSPLRDLARVAALAAVLEAEEGRADEWPDLVELQLKMAGSLDDEPTDISYLVHNAIVRMAIQAVERNLNRASPGAEKCQHLQSAFAHAGGTNLLVRALVGERAMSIPTFRLTLNEAQSFDQEDDAGSAPRTPERYSGKGMVFLGFTGLFERDLDFYLESMEQSISLAALPLPGSLILTNYLDTAGKLAKKKFYLLSSVLLPADGRLIVREAFSQAFAGIVTAALAVERFRLERGRLPGKLQELTPQFLEAIPMDPFDGAPLRYRRLDRGYVIYSVDADGHDDGGREPPEHRKFTDKTSYDLTFTVER